jgi:nuclear cap-binding protein subunit 1
LSAIERCKDRLLAIGPASPAARKQIVTSVMAFWEDQPGVGVNIIDKLLNYTILSPMSVMEWCFPANMDGKTLSLGWLFEIVSTTIFKVSHRLRQLVAAKFAGISEDQKEMIEQSIVALKEEQTAMFNLIEEAMIKLIQAHPKAEDDADGAQSEGAMIRRWAEAWKRVFARKSAVELAAVTLIADQGLLAEVELKKTEPEGNGTA